MEQEFRLRTSQISYYIIFYKYKYRMIGTQDKDWGMGMGNWYGGGRIAVLVV